jgi:subtilisin-like proprotein convertase family protein
MRNGITVRVFREQARYLTRLHMKKTIVLFLILGYAAASHAALIVNQTLNEAIPDGDIAGLATQVTVSGQSGAIGDITVGLNISGAYNGDLYAYVEHDNQIAILLNRVGTTTTDNLGYGDPGLNVTFQDGAPNIHTYQQDPGYTGGTLTGVWGPDGRAVNPLLVNGTEPVTETLSSFVGDDANGTWTLFVADVSGGDLNNLVSWNVDVSVAPENGWYGIGAALFALSLAARPFLFRKPAVLAGLL